MTHKKHVISISAILILNFLTKSLWFIFSFNIFISFGNYTPFMNNRPKPIEIIKGKTYFILDRLYWISDSSPPKNLNKAFYFNIDDVFFILFKDLEY